MPAEGVAANAPPPYPAGAFFVVSQNEVVAIMNATINGEDRQICEASTVESLLRDLSIKPGNVVVELDGIVVPRGQFAGTAVGDGARLEIVEFVGGG